MSKFNIGDTVEYQDPKYRNPKARKGIGTITEIRKGPVDDYLLYTVDIGNDLFYYHEHELSPMPEFKVNDKVRFSTVQYGGAKFQEGTGRISKILDTPGRYAVILDNSLLVGNYLHSELTLIPEEPKFNVGNKVSYNSSRYIGKGLQKGGGIVTGIDKKVNGQYSYRVDLIDCDHTFTWASYLETELSLVENSKIEVGDVVRLVQKNRDNILMVLPDSLAGLEAKVLSTENLNGYSALVEIRSGGFVGSRRYVYGDEMELIWKAKTVEDSKPVVDEMSRLDRAIEDKKIDIDKAKSEVNRLQDYLDCLVRAKELLKEQDG